MRISRTLGLIVLAVSLLQLGGCAGRKGGAPPDDSGSKQSQEVRDDGGVTLPGQNRFLPSEDPRNQPDGEKPKSTRIDARPMYEPPREVEPENPFPSPPVPPGETRFRVQVLASTFPDNALRLREELAAIFGEVIYIEAERGIWKVQVGQEERRSGAQSLRRRLIGLGYEDAFIVECNGR